MAISSAIFIDKGPTVVNQRTFVLTGTNATTIATIQVTGVEASVVQPTTTTWRAEVRLRPGSNVVTINGLDLADNVTASVSRTIVLPLLEDTQHLVHNVFDDFGVMLHLSRLPGEKNLPYKQRLLDVRVHLANTTVRGLTFGASRELGIQVARALSISSPVDGQLGQTLAVAGEIRTNGIYFDLNSPRFVASECHTIEPATLSISLVRIPKDTSSLSVFTMNGDKIDNSLWSYEIKTNRLLFTDRNLADRDVAVTLIYIHRIPLVNKNLNELKAAIEDVVDEDSNPLFQITLYADPSSPAEDLIPTSGFLGIGRLETELERCSLRVRELHDLDFQQSLLNTDGSALGTKLEGWAQSINTQTRIVWNATLLDDSSWEPLGPEPSLGALPHLSDGERGYWYSLDPTDSKRYNRKEFRRYNGISPVSGATLKYRGIKPLEFQSGTGTQKDLKVLDIVEF